MLVPDPNGPLFPEFVAHSSVTFDRKALASFSGMALPELIRKSTRQRQAEFFAGRECARRALRRLGLEETTVPVGLHREPVWPDGIVGAITHSEGLASAAVARTQDARGVGLDVEPVMAEEHVGTLLPKIAAPDEWTSVVRATGFGQAVALTLLFSAKETVFKCLYPQVRRHFGFRAVAIDVPDGISGRFVARLLESLAPELGRGRAFEGRFAIHDGAVRTAMVLQ